MERNVICDYAEKMCGICGDVADKFEAGHVIGCKDVKALKKHFAELKAPTIFPDSINATLNGLLLCGTCHRLFDCPERLVRINSKGRIIVAESIQSEKYRALNNKFVPWKKQLDSSYFPSAELLSFAFTMYQPKQTGVKRKRNE